MSTPLLLPAEAIAGYRKTPARWQRVRAPASLALDNRFARIPARRQRRNCWMRDSGPGPRTPSSPLASLPPPWLRLAGWLAGFDYLRPVSYSTWAARSRYLATWLRDYDATRPVCDEASPTIAHRHNKVSDMAPPSCIIGGLGFWCHESASESVGGFLARRPQGWPPAQPVCPPAPAASPVGDRHPGRPASEPML
ncbi:hypothetical protein CDD83_11194 [Cordyceps sp. RAO-2017]|nr:hypothetical protein CDD83_11194 [Cordyceps sp. RAO-2017]